MRQRRSRSPGHALWLYVGALFAGVLLACAFPPVDWKWVVWFGLIPLLWAIDKSESSSDALLLGAIAGFGFFLITLHPLVSAEFWGGWRRGTAQVFALHMSRQRWLLRGLWIGFALWGACSWGIWAAFLHRYGRVSAWRMLLVATAGWVLVSEWARAQTTFGFTWAFFGNAVADTVFLRQMAAVGGVWLLSALVVMANVALAFGLNRRGRQGWWLMPATVAGVFVAASVGGALYVRSGAGQEHPIRVASLQFPRAPYTRSEFRRLGVKRIYGSHVERALANQLELFVIPESSVRFPLSLDGSRLKPASRPQSFLPEWEQPVRQLLGGHDTVLVIGLDTAEEGAEYNTMVYWSAQGILGWYHKRRLMPFAEYQPRAWGWWGLRGSSEHTPGRGTQLVGTHGLVLGSFICSEVLFPWVTRTSVRDGATVLVTAGNDGVFSDRAVASMHADATQLRAVETGRYIVRAMKTGISAVVDPHGEELVRSHSGQRALLRGHISTRDTMTPYVRFGDWAVWLSAFLLGAVVVVVQGDVAGLINGGLRKSSEATAAVRYGLREVGNSGSRED